MNIGGVFMRKLVLAAGLLGLVAFTGSGSPAQAATGCLCSQLFRAPICAASVGACVGSLHGVCVAPCDYKAPKMSKRRTHKKKM
jgi:hypothetical protein